MGSTKTQNTGGERAVRRRERWKREKGAGEGAGDESSGRGERGEEGEEDGGLQEGRARRASSVGGRAMKVVMGYGGTGTWPDARIGKRSAVLGCHRRRRLRPRNGHTYVRHSGCAPSPCAARERAKQKRKREYVCRQANGQQKEQQKKRAARRMRANEGERRAPAAALHCTLLELD